jgi:hypothetical protein
LWLALYGDDTDPHERDAGAECTKHLAQVYRSKVTVCFFISIEVRLWLTSALEVSQVWRTFKIRQGVLLDCELIP